MSGYFSSLRGEREWGENIRVVEQRKSVMEVWKFTLIGDIVN